MKAAEFRLKELKLEELRKRAALKLGLAPHHFTIESGHPSDLEDLTARICTAVLATVAETSATLRIPVTVLNDDLLGTAILAAAASHLLLNAYESVGRATASDEYKKVATLVAAILFVRPIREMGSTTPSSLGDVQILNQRCALRVAAVLLNIPLKNIDGIDLGRSDHAATHSFESSYLKAFVQANESLVANGILSLGSLSKYNLYNVKNDIHWGDIHEIEYLMSFFMLLDMATSGRRAG